MNSSMIVLVVLSFVMIVSCNIINKNSNQNHMDEVDITTARMFLNMENSGEGQGDIYFGKRYWYREGHRRENWRPREHWHHQW